MAFRIFKQRDIDAMDTSNIPDSFISYFESLSQERKEEIINSRPDLAKGLGYEGPETEANENVEDIPLVISTEVAGDFHEEEDENPGSTEELEEDIFAQIRENLYENLDLDQFFVDEAFPLEILTIPDQTEKCLIHRCKLEKKQLKYKSQDGKVYSLVIKICRECKRAFQEDSHVEHVHKALIERHIPHTFYDIELTNLYLRSMQTVYELEANEKIYIPEVWVEEHPTCPIHGESLYELTCEKTYSGRKITFKGYLCDQCNKILLRSAHVSNLIDECAINGIPQIETEPLVKKVPAKRVLPKREIRPDYFIQEGKRKEYDYAHVANCYNLTEDDTIVISDSVYCRLDGHRTEEVLALIKVQQKRGGRKSYLFLVGYCSECQKYYMDEEDYKVVYNVGRPEVTILSDLEHDDYHISSGEVFNIEREHLKKLEDAIDDEITDIHNQPDYVNPFATGDYDDGNLSFAKAFSKRKYGPQLEKLTGYQPKPYNYRVDIKLDDETETYYVGANDVDLSDGRKVISFNNDFGRELVNYQTMKINKNGKLYDIKLSRQFDIENATLFSYSNLRTDEDIIFRSGVTDPFLVRVLNMRKKQHNLIDIIATIQENQNKIVDAKFEKSIIVQGCAGSGKTMVLLHRLSSLQYKNRYFDFEKSALILTPNDQFSLHIKGLAEGLQLGNIDRESVEQYYIKMLLEYSGDFKPETKLVSEMLVHQGFVDYVYSNQFIADFDAAFEKIITQRNQLKEVLYNLATGMEQTLRPIDEKDNVRFMEQLKLGIQVMESLVKKNSYEIETSKDNLNRIVARKQFLEVKTPEAEKFASEIVKECLPRVFAKIGTYLSVRQGNIAELTDERQQLLDERKMVEDTLFMFGKKAKLQEFDKKISSIDAKLDKQKMIQEEEIAVLSVPLDGKTDDEIMDWMKQVTLYVSDVQDEIRLCKNVKEEAEKYRAEQIKIDEEFSMAQLALSGHKEKQYSEEVTKTIQYLKDKVEEYSILGTYQMVFNEAVADFKKSNDVKTIVGKYHRYDLYAELLFAKKYFGKVQGTTRFMCVDEGQDLALNEYKLISELNQDDVIFNIYGDINQLMKPGRGIADWEELKKLYGADEYVLNENYRNTNQITRFCNSSFGMKVLQTGVDGVKVKEIARKELEKALSSIKITSERLAILIPRSIQKKKYLKEDLLPKHISTLIGEDIGNGLISILYVDEAKGIEFDKVYVDGNKMARNEKYIAYTRALSELILVVNEYDEKSDDESSKQNLRTEKEVKAISKPAIHGQMVLSWKEEPLKTEKELIPLEQEEDEQLTSEPKNADNASVDISEALNEEMEAITRENIPLDLMTNEEAAKAQELNLTLDYLKLKSFSGASAKEGKYIDLPFSEDDVMDAINMVFSSNSRKDTSYKFVFLKSITDLLSEVDDRNRLSFDQIFQRFTEIYWPIVVEHNLSQKIGNEDNKSYVEQILCDAAHTFGITTSLRFSDLTKKQQKDVVTEVKKKCKMNVVGALHGDTKAMLYAFSRKEEWIEINPAVYDYLVKNASLIQEKNYVAWADFMTKTNSNVANNTAFYLQILKKIFGMNLSALAIIVPFVVNLLRVS